MLKIKDIIEEVKRSHFNGVLTELDGAGAINYIYDSFEEFTYTQVFNRLSIEAQDVLYSINNKLEAGAI